MSRSLRGLWVYGSVGLLAAGITGLAWWGLPRLFATDPLARFRPDPSQAEQPGIEVTNFEWKVYDKDRIVAQARVERATVGRDRERVEMFAVTDGRYWASRDESFGFQAARAVYLENTRALTGEGGARVWTTDMALGAESFSYDARSETLTVPGLVRGKLQGGDIKTEGLLYRVRDRSIEVGPLAWQGMVDQDGERRRWRFEALDPKGRTSIRGNVTTFGKVRATDGEVIVKADSAVYDREKDVLTAKGNIRYFSEDANLTCDDVVVYRAERRAVLTGRVVMLMKPKEGRKLEEVEIPALEPVVPEEIKKGRPAPPPDDSARREQEERLRTGRNLRDYPLRITSSRVEYWYARGATRAVATGSPQARQDLGPAEWRMVWADRGVWDGEAETLRMEGQGSRVRMLNSIGDDLTAAWVQVSTREGEDVMDAEDVKGEIQIRDDELPDRRRSEPTDPPARPPISGPIGRSSGQSAGGTGPGLN